MTSASAGEGDERDGGGGGGGGGAGGGARCGRCNMGYNCDEKCPRTLLCGHTCCTSCLDELISGGSKRCPTCNRQFFSLSVVLIPKNLEVLNGLEKASSGLSKSPYSSRLGSSLSGDSAFEVRQSSEKLSQSSRSLEASKSSYSSRLGSSLSSESAFEVRQSSEKLSQSLVSSKSSYSSKLGSSLSSDSSFEELNSSEKSSHSSWSSESRKSSLKSSYSSPFRSSSYDSNLERPKTSSGSSSGVFSLRSSSSFGSSSEAKESEGSERSEWGKDPSGESSGGLSPPPVPSSAPPSLQESYSDLLTSKVRSQECASALEVNESGRGDQDAGSGGGTSGDGGGGGGSGQSSSGRSYEPPTYSFPTIRTKLNINGSRKQENDAATSSLSSGKAELRPAKSLPPFSTFPSSSSSSSSLSPLSPLGKKENVGPSSSSSSAGYTSPFKSSTSSFSTLKTNSFRSISSESQKLSLKDNAATDSERESRSKPLYSSSSSFTTNTFRSLSNESQKPALTNTPVTDSEKETNSKTSSTSYSSLSSSTLDSTDGSSRSKSLPSLHKLDARLSVPTTADKKDEVDLGISRWKMETSSLLSRKIDAKDAPSRRSEGQNAAFSASSSSKASRTPSHVLRMIRSVTSKTRPADDKTEAANDESNTTSSSYKEDASSSSSSSSSSFSSSSLTTSKNTHTLSESGQFRQQGATTQQVSQSAAAPDASPTGKVTPAGESDGPSGSTSQPPSSGHNGGAADAFEGRHGMTVLGSQAEAEVQYAPAAAPSTGSRGEESKERRKLALSDSLSARLGARTRFLAAAIDEASEEEEHAGGGVSSAGWRQVRAGREDKLYKPDRHGMQQQQQQQQLARPRLSLGARISARTGYLSGGRGGEGSEASQGEVQAEDSTKIALQRRTGRARTKDEAAEGGHDGTPSEDHGAAGAAGAHLATHRSDPAGDVEVKLRSSGPAQSRQPSTLGDEGDPEGDGTSPGAASSGRGDQRGARGSAASTHESSKHTRWRRHRPIDSQAKEELSDLGCVPREAGNHVPSSTTELPEATASGAPMPDAPHDAGSTAAQASAALQGQHGDAEAPRRHYHRWTKRNDTSDGSSHVFRSEAESVTDTSRIAERRPGAGRGHGEGDVSTPPPLPPSGPFPWRKKWRSVTELTSSSAVRQTSLRETTTTLTSKPKQPEQQPQPPCSTPPSGEALGDGEGSEARITSLNRAPLGALAIGRVPSVQDTDGDGKMASWSRGLGTTRTEPRRATEDTTEDINMSLRRARERLRATTTTPTEETPPPGPTRTNLAYLLTRVQGNEATSRTTMKTTLSDDDEVFEDSEDEVNDDKHPKQPESQPSNSTDGGMKTHRPGTLIPSTTPVPEGHGWEATTDEVDSTTRRRSNKNDTKGHDGKRRQNNAETRQEEINGTVQDDNETTEEQDFDEAQQTGRRETDEAQETHEDTPDAPYEAPPGDYETRDAQEGEYEPGVGLCSSHGLMLDLYCQDCQEWVCKDCLRVLHRPRPNGSCEVISAAEGVNQIKITHSSFLTSRSNTLEYFRAELRRIIEECNNSINLHKDNIRRLDSKIEEERRLLRGIKSMRSLAKEKMKHVDYWEEVLQDNLSRIDESSTSQDVIKAVQESSGDILRKAMEAVSVEAGAGLLLAPPN